MLASQQSLVNVEQTVLLSAVSAYVNLGLQGELVAAQESNVRLITQDLRAAKDRFDVGEVTRTDVALAEAQLASARAALASAQGNYNVARESYNAAIGHYPGKLSGLPKYPVTAKTLEAAREIALRTHPAVLQAQHQESRPTMAWNWPAPRCCLRSMVRLRCRSNSWAMGPGRCSPVGQSGAIEESIGITMTQTIYAGGQLSSQLRKAIAQQQQAHAGLLQTGVSMSKSGRQRMVQHPCVECLDQGGRRTDPRRAGRL